MDMESKNGDNKKGNRTVLCAANQYEKKYYLNEMFYQLPPLIQEELKIIFVLYTEEVGGILTAYFDDDGSLYFETICEPQDFLYDPIGSGLKIKQMQEDKKELWESIEKFYVIFIRDKKE